MASSSREKAALCASCILHCALMKIVFLSKRTPVFDLKTGVFVLVGRQGQTHRHFSCTPRRAPVPLHPITLLFTLKTNVL